MITNSRNPDSQGHYDSFGPDLPEASAPIRRTTRAQRIEAFVEIEYRAALKRLTPDLPEHAQAMNQLSADLMMRNGNAGRELGRYVQAYRDVAAEVAEARLRAALLAIERECAVQVHELEVA